MSKIVKLFVLKLDCLCFLIKIQSHLVKGSRYGKIRGKIRGHEPKRFRKVQQFEFGFFSEVKLFFFKNKKWVLILTFKRCFRKFPLSSF